MPYSISSRFAYTLKYVLCSKALMQFAKFYFVKKGEKKFIKFYFSTVFFRKLHNVCNFTKKLFFLMLWLTWLLRVFSQILQFNCVILYFIAHLCPFQVVHLCVFEKIYSRYGIIDASDLQKWTSRYVNNRKRQNQ